MAGMVTSDSDNNTASRNDYVAGIHQASDSDSNDKSSSSASSRVCKNNTLQVHSFQAEQTGGTGNKNDTLTFPRIENKYTGELILPFQVFHTALKARNDRIVNEILCC